MNKIIGFLIVLIYFGNYHICNLFHENDVAKFWDLKVSIYCVLIILSIKYKSYKLGFYGLLESIFISIVINNTIVNYFFNEKYYTYSDLIIVPLIILIEYAKYYKINSREYLHNIIRSDNIDIHNKK